MTTRGVPCLERPLDVAHQPWRVAPRSKRSACPANVPVPALSVNNGLCELRCWISIAPFSLTPIALEQKHLGAREY